jgi:hypothetical protein
VSKGLGERGAKLAGGPHPRRAVCRAQLLQEAQHIRTIPAFSECVAGAAVERDAGERDRLARVWSLVPTVTPVPTATPLPALPDLIVDLPSPPFVFNCDPFRFICDHAVEVFVQNIGSGPSNATNVVVNMSNGLTSIAGVPPLPPSGAFNTTVFMGGGPNCFEFTPSCITTAQVDAPNTNVESNEANNTDTRAD